MKGKPKGGSFYLQYDLLSWRSASVH